MIAYKMEKEVTLYKSQFDTAMLQLFNGTSMDRVSMDLDGILFRMKYMIKHQKDLDKLPELKEQFGEKSLVIQKMFGTFMYSFLQKITEGTMSMDYLVDVMVKDVKMDPVYCKFTMVLVAANEEFLQYVDNAIPSDQAYNLFPNQYFRFFTDSYNDGVAKAYPELFAKRHVDGIGEGADGDVFCHNFTFQVTEDCSLLCSYCYQCNKSPMRMDFDTAKKFIDHLLADEYGYINRHNSPAIIIEFIGGEPLLEIKLIRKIYEYFLDRCYEMDHPWFHLHRLSICSNGMQYFDPEVQDFFKEYYQNISFNISIDGNKELHDSCRVQPNGEGSYDVDIIALEHYTKHYTAERNSKMTLAPSNIRYLFDSVVDFIDKGMRIINLNCIFEEGWNQKTAREEYEQLRKLATYILDNDMEHLYIAIFRERQEEMQPKDHDSNFCGGQGAMLAMRPNGQFYPCIRYMPSSVGPDVPDLCLGDVNTGLKGRGEGSEILKQMDRVTRRSQSNDICYECPIGNSCAWCSALGHAVYGTSNKRPMFICIQMIAEALANVYYWNLLNIKHPEYNLGVRKNNVPDEWALLVIDKDELEFLKQIEAYSMIVTLENRAKE